MKLGIDFGTNRIVVAAADRGNYPLISFESPDGTTPDWYPSLIALHGGERLFGWQAWDKQNDDSWIVVRSIKRLLEDAGPRTVLDLDDRHILLTELLNGLASALLTALRDSSNLSLKPEEPLQTMLGVPAHANSNQRFLTVEAFRVAGFDVLGVLNEPSAASIEFGHRQRQSKSGSETILVYDLGGGTFDASLVSLDENVHHVIASAGISTIGGDDFDHLLADLALDAADIDLKTRDDISAAAWFRLLEECRTKKETLNPNSRRLTIDLEHMNPDWGSVQIQVAEFYDMARPLVEETIAAAEDLLAQRDGEFEALYITGGGSELPLVSRVLRERFGRRVRRSTYARSATAIGLAIQADQPDAYRLSERLARSFGVWREADGGSRVVFDPLFEKGISLPPPGLPPISIRRIYSPVHNIGHFRFLECSHRGVDGSPSGEVALWDEIYFPYDPALQVIEELKPVAVMHSSNGSHSVEELYECDSGGSITVTISDLTTNCRRVYRLGHWSRESKPVKPASRRKRAAAAGKT
jgi:molecular chaperone DnaK (HSP70)